MSEKSEVSAGQPSEKAMVASKKMEEDRCPHCYADEAIAAFDYIRCRAHALDAFAKEARKEEFERLYQKIVDLISADTAGDFAEMMGKDHHRNWPNCPTCADLMKQDQEGAVLNSALEERVHKAEAAVEEAQKERNEVKEARVREYNEKLEWINKAGAVHRIQDIDNDWKVALDKAVEEARRARDAEWCAKLLADNLRDSAARREERARLVQIANVQGAAVAMAALGFVRCKAQHDESGQRCLLGEEHRDSTGEYAIHQSDNVTWLEAIRSRSSRPPEAPCFYCAEKYPRVAGKHFVEGKWTTPCTD